MAEIILTDKNFQAEVVQKKEPILVDFWAAWCGPCRTMEPILQDLARDFENKLGRVARLNVDENQEIASKYGVMSIPTFLVFSGGEVFGQVVGVQPKERLAELLHEALKKVNE